MIRPYIPLKQAENTSWPWILSSLRGSSPSHSWVAWHTQKECLPSAATQPASPVSLLARLRVRCVDLRGLYQCDSSGCSLAQKQRQLFLCFKNSSPPSFTRHSLPDNNHHFHNNTQSANSTPLHWSFLGCPSLRILTGNFMSLLILNQFP